MCSAAQDNKEVGQLEAQELEKGVMDSGASLPALEGESRLALAQQLLQALSAEREQNETKKAYEDGMIHQGTVYSIRGPSMILEEIQLRNVRSFVKLWPFQFPEGTSPI